MSQVVTVVGTALTSTADSPLHDQGNDPLKAALRIRHCHNQRKNV
ncbi:MAG: hypothetical protein ACLQDY_15270 [Streptosporangiaceae bacterium]